MSNNNGSISTPYTPNPGHGIQVTFTATQTQAPIYTHKHTQTHKHTNTNTHTHTNTHMIPSVIVAGDVLRYFNFSLAASVNMFRYSRALATSLHDAVMVVFSQYCSMYILQCSTTPSCSMLILSNTCTGTSRYAPSICQSVTSLSSFINTATVSSGVSTHA